MKTKLNKLLLLMALVFSSCFEVSEQRTIVDPPTANEYSTIIVDSCEYLQYYSDLYYAFAYTKHDYKAKFITHKGNCKYCAERNKIK